jgi:hypothetical protein
MMEIVRLLAETTDNYLLLQASAQTLQQHVLPLLDELHQGHLSCLERWQIEWDIYQGQVGSMVRPTMRWQQGSAQENMLARKQQWAAQWYQHEQQRLQQRTQQIQEAMQRHEAHLEECASRFVHQGLRPECIAGIAAVVQEHQERIRVQRERLSQQHAGQVRQIDDLQTQYQDEMQRLQHARQGTETQWALAKKGVTTGWIVQNLFGIGTPSSLSLTQRVMQQMEASHHFNWYVRSANHYFWYSEQVWKLHPELPAKVQVLSERWTHWNRLLGVLDDSSDPTVILLALSGH